jgi:phenylacetate-CoA ligase
MRLMSRTRVLTDIPRLLRHPRASREQIIAFQARRLRELVRHAYDNVPYYRRLFDDAGITPNEIRGLADLDRIPITTKSTLQALGGSDMIARGLSTSSLIKRRTSGSTGIPLTLYRQRAEQLLPALFLRRVRGDLGLTRGARVSALVAGSYRPRSRSITSRGRRQLQRVAGIREWTRIDSTLPIDRVATLLRDSKPDVISGYPGILGRLAHHLSGESQQIQPRLIVSSAELLTPTMRESIEHVFQAPVRDTYSCYELGLLAWECPLGGTYHVCDDNAIVEIGSEAGADSGELIGTSLHFAAMPIIRYRLGDIVTRGPDQCRCGSPFTTLASINGRTVDYVTLPDGSLLHTQVIDAVVWSGGFGWVHRYQVVQERRDRVVMHVIPRREPTRDEVQEIERAAREVLEHSVDFSVLLVEAIADDATGKFSTYRSQL